MYSLKELTDNVVNGLDELFNVNIKHFCVTYSENGCLMKLVTNTNSDSPIRMALSQFDEGITVSISVNWMIKRDFTDYNILDLQEMTTLIVLMIKSSFIAYCHVRGI